MNHAPSLHVITDEELQSEFSHVELCCELVVAGADVIQYREKRQKDTAELCAVATAMSNQCSSTQNTALVVNDRVDVAVACKAAGVHLGAKDLSVDVARGIVGKGVIIGGTANSLSEAESVWGTPVDYLGVGPVFGTKSKASPAPILGLEQLRVICERSPKPVIAIGNIRLENVRDVISAGAAGVAVLSAIVCDRDPKSATVEFKRALAETASSRG